MDKTKRHTSALLATAGRIFPCEISNVSRQNCISCPAPIATRQGTRVSCKTASALSPMVCSAAKRAEITREHPSARCKIFSFRHNKAVVDFRRGHGLCCEGKFAAESPKSAFATAARAIVKPSCWPATAVFAMISPWPGPRGMAGKHHEGLKK